MEISEHQSTRRGFEWSGPARAAAVVTGALLIWTAMKYGQIKLLGGIGLAIGTVFALTNSEVGLYIVTLLLGIDGFIKNLHASYVTMVLKDYFVVLCLLRWAGPIAQGYNPPSLRSKPSPWIIAFLLYAFTQLFNQYSPGPLASLAGLRTWILWLPLYYIGYEVLRDRVRVQNWMSFTAWVLLGVAAFAIYQGSAGLGAMAEMGEGFGVLAQRSGYGTEAGGQERIYGTTVSAGTLGGLMAHGILMVLGLFCVSRAFWPKVMYSGMGVAYTVALFLSGSRLPVVTLSSALAPFILMTRRYRLLLVFGAVAAMGLAYVGSKTEGRLYQRLQTLSWSYAFNRTAFPMRRAWKLASEHPFGVGTGTGRGIGRMATSRYFGGVMQQRIRTTGVFIENEYGQAMAAFGFPGAFLFVAMLVATTWNAWRSVRASPDTETRDLRAALFANLILIIVGLSVGSALYGAGPLFWLPAAVLVRALSHPETPSVELRRRRRTGRTGPGPGVDTAGREELEEARDIAPVPQQGDDDGDERSAADEQQASAGVDSSPTAPPAPRVIPRSPRARRARGEGRQGLPQG